MPSLLPPSPADATSSATPRLRCVRSARKLHAQQGAAAVEFALVPFALYHFHKAGLYGVAANLIAIPLTTFVVMPLEAGALLLLRQER